MTGRAKKNSGGIMKNWYESKTVWVNILTLALGIIGIFVTSATDLGIPPQTVAILTGIVVPIINVVLRFITNEGIKVK